MLNLIFYQFVINWLYFYLKRLSLHLPCEFFDLCFIMLDNFVLSVDNGIKLLCKQSNKRNISEDLIARSLHVMFYHFIFQFKILFHDRQIVSTMALKHCLDYLSLVSTMVNRI